MKRHFNCFVIIFLLTAFNFSAIAQDTLIAKKPIAHSHFKTAGGIIGFGNAFSDNTNYKIFYLAGDLSWSVGKALKKDFVSVYFEPQVNLVHTDRPWDFEAGANAGIRNYIKINEGFYFYQMLGSGPHYISARLDRQATGFIFSDNLFLGSLLRLQNSLFLNLQFGIRHISNAGLKLPNRGVNAYNFRVGISRKK